MVHKQLGRHATVYHISSLTGFSAEIGNRTQNLCNGIDLFSWCASPTRGSLRSLPVSRQPRREHFPGNEFVKSRTVAQPNTYVLR